MTGFKEIDSPFLKERGEGIGPIWGSTYTPTPFQLEGGARSCPFDTRFSNRIRFPPRKPYPKTQGNIIPLARQFKLRASNKQTALKGDSFI